MNRPDAYVWVPCTFPGCPVELRVIAAHVPNLAPTWRCLTHRQENAQ